MKISSSLIKVGMCAIASSLIVVALAGKDAPTTEKTAIEKVCQLQISSQSAGKIQQSIGPVLAAVEQFKGIHPEALKPMCQHIKNIGIIPNKMDNRQLNEVLMAKSMLGLSLSYQLSKTPNVSLVQGKAIGDALESQGSKRWTQADVLVNLREEAKRFAQENAALADVSVDKLNYEIRGNDVSKSSDFTSYIEQNFQP